ncbi:Transcriptional regulatory protein AfsQ1 [Aquimixticola soesokkakensis]|uniref:Transcriptional regulatory protein AfsQ1 n=1 Tax=Aquimixticola soesokkakensis TaxID=1519096 RepID=A0A1Y5TGF2_9RHOB|nr:response regulator [Aquimixticola soesokkakensis]SLN63646.1 Transcriptional regulatory protein AfsQ1 [Aquimixticola soesokkakensis]
MATILIADDDPAYLQAFEAGMTAMGHHVVTASGGKSVGQIITRNLPPIDIVFLDFIMPGGGGVSSLHVIKQLRPTLPVIIISGHVAALDSPIFLEGMALADDKLAKTAPLAFLHAIVQQFTSGSER